MARAWMLAVAAAALALPAGCAKMAKSSRMDVESIGGYAMAAPAAPAQSARAPSDQNRMLIWTASLTLEVGNVSNAAAAAVQMTKAAGGYIEREWSSDHSMSLTLRVPAKTLHATVERLEDLGEVTYRNVSSQDVTAEFVDTDARLKNMVVLRDRLRVLLDKATEVKDILSIETELGRIQGDIESMEARLRSLKGQVDLSEITVTFERKRILGPLGYAVKGIYWAISKLFVIRD